MGRPVKPISYRKSPAKSDPFPLYLAGPACYNGYISPFAPNLREALPADG